MRRIVLIFIIAFVAGLAAVFGASSWEPVKLAQVGSTVEVTTPHVP